MKEDQPARPKRLMWLVNHKALIPSELPILRELGYEIYVPKVIPPPGPFRSGATTYEYDGTLSIPPNALTVLNEHEFYERAWSPTIRAIVNEYFDVAIVHMSSFITAFEACVLHFEGKTLARVFGLEYPRTYAGMLEYYGKEHLAQKAAALRERFIFAQAYPNIAEVEPSALTANTRTVGLLLPPLCFRYAGTWRGDGEKAIMLCPSIQKAGYYRDIYTGLKRNFGDLPHAIFGRQVEKLDDPAVLPYLTDAEMFDLFAAAPVFIYPHTEPRHIHYSHVEAMVVGTPVLYLRGALTDALAGYADLAGACEDVGEMHLKAERLIRGDRELASRIRADQTVIVDAFNESRVRAEWAAALNA